MRLVYVAGPYGMPNPVRNTRAAVDAAESLWEFGIASIVPHMTLLWDFVYPHEEQEWYDMDLEVVRRCDALLRLPGHSVGADLEVRCAEDHGIPVFRDIAECVVALRPETAAQWRATRE